MTEEYNQVPTKVEHDYNANQIDVLEGLEAVRKRPGMYIGSTGPRGLHHLVYEIVDNAIDEALAGYCKNIVVDILPDNIISVLDDGRGIPVDIQPKMNMPAVTVVYTVLHAGGKFGSGGYGFSGGLHGVGASVVNALSEWLEVEVYLNGKIYSQRFERGEIACPLTIQGDTDRQGTKVTFKADYKVFEELEYDYDILLTRLREQAFLNAGLNIELSDLREVDHPSTHKLHYEGGIRSFVTHLNQAKGSELVHPDVIYFSGAENGNIAEVALQYNDSYNETILSFANNINTVEGGTHETGFKAALTRVFNDYGRKYSLLKENDKNLSGEDVREGMIAVVSVKVKEAQFEGQTKSKLGNT
jgi:DNA gyrase subunit B